jgi:hypothetical protein
MITIKRVLVVAPVLGTLFVLQAASAGSHEILTDRCSGEVAFTPRFDENPTAHGTVILKRQSDGYSPVSSFHVTPDKDGNVRWWCHSTIGNVFDPGTWRVHVDGKALLGCLVSPVAPIDHDGIAAGKCLKTVKISSTSFQGWTPERSRCKDHSTKLTARLGPDRVLTTECMGK